MWLADVIEADPALDIAVVRIRGTFAGDRFDAATTNLPSVRLGDSDAVELGDTLNVFGYPGIGGDTITYTSGPVSGFARDAKVPGRAWIKTSASISGGNSGGTGVDDDGLLVGVPTRTGVEGAGAFVDCRRLADTNADGRIDEKDTCIPTGGFLNSLRAVNVAKALIARAVDAPVPGTDDGDQPSGGSGSGSGDEPDDEPDAETTRTIEVTGRITDAATGRPIPGATFVVLREGAKWAGASLGDAIALGRSDRKGAFELDQPVPVGRPLAMGAFATGYRPVTSDTQTIPADATEPVAFDIRLERS